MPTEINNLSGWPIKRRAFKITLAEIKALGNTATSGTITLPMSLPPKSKVLSAFAWNNGTAGATLSTLTVKIGDAGNDDRYMEAQTVLAANAGDHAAPDTDTPASATADTPVTVLITGNADLNTLTGLDDGITVGLTWIEG